MISKILQLHILQASRALRPDVQSPYQLHHYRLMYVVNAMLMLTILQPGHTLLPPFMCATKQPMQIILPRKVSWIGRFRMFVQLGHWKSAREMLDVRWITGGCDDIIVLLFPG